MKKMISLLLCFVVLLMLGGCGPSFKPLPEPGNKMVVTIPQAYVNNLVYEGKLPELVINFTDKVNVATFSTDNFYILTKNDDFKISTDIGTFLGNYEGQSIITKTTAQAAETDIARLGGKKLPLDEPSYDYNHIITTTEGTRYSLQYRKFISEGVTYYGWTYNNGITISMEMPLMLSKMNDTRVLYLLPLPYNTRYEVSANLELDKLIGKDTYLNESYYTFFYPTSLGEVSLQEKINQVKQWYTEHTNGHMEGDQFVITYLGIQYVVDFNKRKVDKDTKVETDAFALRIK